MNSRCLPLPFARPLSKTRKAARWRVNINAFLMGWENGVGLRCVPCRRFGLATYSGPTFGKGRRRERIVALG